MIKIDQKFPDFTLEYYDPVSKKVSSLKNSDLTGWTILFYYPADFTFVCPTELADFAKKYDEFQKLNCQVLAISTDTVYTHKAWVETEKLLKDVKYLMLADRNGNLAKELEIYNEITGNAQRGVYIIDPEGNIKSIQVVTEKIGRSAGEVLRQVKALKFITENPGEACPASWETGDPTLTPDISISGKVYTSLHK